MWRNTVQWRCAATRAAVWAEKGDTRRDATCQDVRKSEDLTVIDATS